jgi:GTP-binding protein Era
MATDFHSGFVTIIGRPNVGKSTLINSLIGRKVAITSDKPQTTRRRIQAVLTDEDFQAVFIDTPGLHQPKHRLGEYMNRQAVEALDSVDLVLWIIDSSHTYLDRSDIELAEQLSRVDAPLIAVFNKADLEQTLKPEQYLKSSKIDVPWIKVSALTGAGMEDLVRIVREHLPQGPVYYPDGMLTDHPEQFIAAEFIREAVLESTQDEIPHSVAVVIEEMAVRPNGKVYIRAYIYGERESQKGILIGAQGRLLKEIGVKARKEIEELLGSPVFLDLWVKTRKDWRNSDSTLREWGFD